MSDKKLLDEVVKIVGLSKKAIRVFEDDYKDMTEIAIRPIPIRNRLLYDDEQIDRLMIVKIFKSLHYINDKGEEKSYSNKQIINMICENKIDYKTALEKDTQYLKKRLMQNEILKDNISPSLFFKIVK